MHTLRRSPLFLATFIAATLMAQASLAACFADYKAKRDGPLRLHYGVVELPEAACTDSAAAARAISSRIARDGWTLLNVMSIFGRDGLEERKASAGEFYLRY